MKRGRRGRSPLLFGLPVPWLVVGFLLGALVAAVALLGRVAEGGV